MSCCDIRNSRFHMEFVVFSLFFSVVILAAVETNFVIYRTCYIILGYNISECALLGSGNQSETVENLEKLTEPHASIIMLFSSIIPSIFCSITVLFIGSWSDKFGRKPALVCALIGYTIKFAIMTGLTLFPYISPWYFLLSCIPVLCTGGLPTLLTVTFCYVTDITNASNRGIRLGVFEGIMALGVFLGNVSTSFLFNTVGYTGIYAITTSCFFMVVFYTIFLVPESVQNAETKDRLRSFFDISNLKDMVNVTFKKRPDFDRAIIIVCLFQLSMIILILNAEESVLFLYLRNRFNWDLQIFTFYNASHNFAWILGSIVGVWLFHKVLQIEESVLVLVGFISVLNSALLQGLATKSWHIFAGGVIKSLGSFLSPMIRSLVSLIAPAQDLGKIFSAIVASESLIGLLGSPAYTALYNATLKSVPQAFNFVTAGIYVICVALTLLVMYFRSRGSTVKYNHIGVNIIDEDLRSENS